MVDGWRESDRGLDEGEDARAPHALILAAA